MSLQDRLDAFRTQFEAGGPPFNAPAHIHAVMHRATHQLIASHAADKALKVGATAPDFSLKDSDGQAIALADLLRSGPLILTFYRGVWCPYCNLDLQALQMALPEFQKRGAQLVAISPQIAANSRRSQREAFPYSAILETTSRPSSACGSNFPTPCRIYTKTCSRMTWPP